MYYILNETGQVIAADEIFMSHCGVSDVSGLSSKVNVGDTAFTSQDENSVTITSDGTEQTFSASKTTLSSILGSMTLVALKEERTTESNDGISTDAFLLDTLDERTEEKLEALDLDEAISFDTPAEKEDITFDTHNDQNETELFEIMDSLNEDLVDQKQEAVPLDTDELFTLMEDNANVSEERMEDESEIVVDIANNSQDIGISDEDYTEFLNEYIDTALALEEDLQNDDMSIRNRAIDTLTDLSEVMRLPEISAIMRNIHASTPEQQKGYMGSLYTTLSRLTTQSSSNQTVATTQIEDTISQTEAAPVAKAPNPNSFGTIDLSDVKPKHFDFQLEEAANDLSLPVELIEEFVHDFIEQAHIETKKMLEAYEEGDLAKIQAIGHLLKGASSNLRINALSDTLYKIQFCESENGLDGLIKDYWAHFLSFETQINVISN